MNDAMTATLYIAVLGAAVLSAPDAAGETRRRLAPGTLAATVLVGTVSVLQLAVAPHLLNDLERDRAAIADGQLWRVVTSLVVQDGGWPGFAFNLVALALVGTQAERCWGLRRWLVIVAAVGVGAQLWGLLVQPVGGGNSVVNFGLAASLAVAALLGGDRPRRLLAAVCLSSALVLLAVGDLHGGAAAIGSGAGWLAYRTLPPTGSG